VEQETKIGLSLGFFCVFWYVHGCLNRECWRMKQLCSEPVN